MMGKGTKVWGEYEDRVIGKFVDIGDGLEGLRFATFSTNCSLRLSVRKPLLARHPGPVHSRTPRSNRSARWK